MTTDTTRPVRVPVGSCVAVAPPAAGKTTVLRSALTAAGLTADRIVSPDELRLRFARGCASPGCRMVPSNCTHFDSQLHELISATANAHLIAGETWFYDQSGCDEDALRAEVARAHRAGLAATAFRVVHKGRDVPVMHLFQRDARRTRRTPQQVIADAHAAYKKLTTARLYELGFDLVIEWDEDIALQLMPEGCDARHITTPLAVVGDLHGCARTFFSSMLPALGLDAELSNPDVLLVSVGDIHDKGGTHDGQASGAVELIRWWLRMIRSGRALMVDSNHNKALIEVLLGRREPRFGLAQTLAEIDAQPDAAQLRADILATFSRVPTHLVFDHTVIAHAAMTEDRLLRNDRPTQAFAVHTRYENSPWEWTGTQTLVHGHVIVGHPDRRRAPADPARPGHVPGEVVNVDTGAYAGGGMTAYLSQTGETVTVPSAPEDLIDPQVQERLMQELLDAGIIPSLPGRRVAEAPAA